MTFTYYNPVKIDFGNGALQRLPKWLGQRKALLVTTEGFKKRGLVQQMLENNREITQVIDTIKPNPTLKQLEELYKSLDFETFDVIVALGGGSVIDISKALSIYFDNPSKNFFERIESMLVDGERYNDSIYKPIIAIPTTAGTGSEVTPWGTIWDDVNKKKFSIHTKDLWCEVAICDPELTVTLPKELTIQTGLDALSHSLESIWNVNANPISSMYAQASISEVIDVLPKLVNDLTNLQLRERLMLASLKAGMAFSNTQTAIAHAMSYYMTLHKDIPHGIAVSITLPEIMQVAVEDKALKSQLQKGLGNDPINKVENLLNSLDIVTNYSYYDLSLEDFVSIKHSLSQTSRSKNSLIDSGKLFEIISSTF